MGIKRIRIGLNVTRDIDENRYFVCHSVYSGPKQLVANLRKDVFWLC